MGDRTAARRYATAFLSLAEELDQVAAFGADLASVHEAASGADGLLMSVLANPVFTADERRGVLNGVLPQLNVQPMTANLLRLMVDNGRFGALPDMIEIYNDAADALAGRLRVEVTTADPLTDELAAEIRAALGASTGREIVLDTKLDSALIGGLVARVGGKVYDASMRARLEGLKYRLIKGMPAGEA